jgi:hypothetical protein
MQLASFENCQDYRVVAKKKADRLEITANFVAWDFLTLAAGIFVFSVGETDHAPRIGLRQLQHARTVRWALAWHLVTGFEGALEGGWEIVTISGVVETVPCYDG